MTCKFCGYDSKFDDPEKPPADARGLDSSVTLQAGARVMILWGSSWYLGKIERVVTRDSAVISYDGWDASWNETVDRSRLRMIESRKAYRVGDSVLIAYDGSWYPGTILSAHGDAYRIRYTGYDASWDEDVGADRLQPA